MGIQLEISELSSRSVMTNHDSCPTADRWGRLKRTIRTSRSAAATPVSAHLQTLKKDGPFAQGQAIASCVLQPEGFQHLVQPNSAEVSSVIGSHASTHAIAMIAPLGNERPMRVSTNPAA